MGQPTNYREFFQEARASAPQPPEAVWEGVRRGLKRKDFWRVKGKLLCAGVALSVGAFALWMSVPESKVVENFSMETPEEAAVSVASAAVSDDALPLPEKKAEVKPLAAGKASPVETVSCPENGESVAESIRQLLDEFVSCPAACPAEKALARAEKTEENLAASASFVEKSPSPVAAEEAVSVAAPAFRISFPSAFTPNGDGLNDTYRPMLSGSVTQYVFRVYNRQRQLVFQSVHPEEGWDGTFRGTPQPHGAYVCVLSCTTKEGEKRSAKAEFLLLRD
ncbi:MAG: gliding motility-associated C-terminal domain-containing protein [Bacteroidales bacterium]|nr:gliding motility-associated C-terminal domain-containing protein [Bacteroidales bacterium]